MGVHMPQILVVGLGNLPFPLTRHSVGQLAIDSLASRLGIHMSSDRSGYIGHSEVAIGSRQVMLTLFKSKSLMNISGPSIAAVYRRTVGSPKSMVVLQDSLSHDSEVVSLKLGGSANGHNGVKSIISALGGEMGFYRLRMGIGRNDTDAAEYVLRKLSGHERQHWSTNGEGIEHILTEIEKIVSKG